MRCAGSSQVAELKAAVSGALSRFAGGEISADQLVAFLAQMGVELRGRWGPGPVLKPATLGMRLFKMQLRDPGLALSSRLLALAGPLCNICLPHDRVRHRLPTLAGLEPCAFAVTAATARRCSGPDRPSWLHAGRRTWQPCQSSSTARAAQRNESSAHQLRRARACWQCCGTRGLAHPQSACQHCAPARAAAGGAASHPHVCPFYHAGCGQSVRAVCCFHTKPLGLAPPFLHCRLLDNVQVEVGEGWLQQMRLITAEPERAARLLAAGQAAARAGPSSGSGTALLEAPQAAAARQACWIPGAARPPANSLLCGACIAKHWMRWQKLDGIAALMLGFILPSAPPPSCSGPAAVTKLPTPPKERPAAQLPAVKVPPLKLKSAAASAALPEAADENAPGNLALPYAQSAAATAASADKQGAKGKKGGTLRFMPGKKARLGAGGQGGEGGGGGAGLPGSHERWTCPQHPCCICLHLPAGGLCCLPAQGRTGAAP